MSIALILRETQFSPERNQITFNIKRKTALDLTEATNLKIKLNTERKQPALPSKETHFWT